MTGCLLFAYCLIKNILSSLKVKIKPTPLPNLEALFDKSGVNEYPPIIEPVFNLITVKILSI